MSTVTIKVEDFVKLINESVNSDLGEVYLSETASNNQSESGPIKDPNINPAIPYDMDRFEPIPNNKLVFSLWDIKCIRYFYMLSRGNARYEVGELLIISDAVKSDSKLETVNQKIPNLYFQQDIIKQVNAPLNLELNVLNLDILALPDNPIITFSGSNDIWIYTSNTSENPHNLSVGDIVTLYDLVGFNGILNLNMSYIVTGIISPTIFKVFSSYTATSSGSGGGTLGTYFNPKKRTNKFTLGYKNTLVPLSLPLNPVTTVFNSTEITITCSSNHNFLEGDTVVINNLTDTNGIKLKELNGYKKIHVKTLTQFSYNVDSQATSSGSGGGSSGICILKEPLFNCSYLRLFSLK